MSQAARWRVRSKRAQNALSTIGFLGPASADSYRHRLRGFHRGVKEIGFVEGENVAVEFAGRRIESTTCLSWWRDLARLGGGAANRNAVPTVSRHQRKRLTHSLSQQVRDPN